MENYDELERLVLFSEKEFGLDWLQEENTPASISDSFTQKKGGVFE